MTVLTESPQGLDGLVPGTWDVDPTHSSVAFTARHAMVTKVRGSFTEFSGAITVADNPLVSSVRAEVDLASLNSGNADRDAHVKAADFLDVEQFPTMTFQSTSIRESADGYVVTGDLTVHGVTRPVDLELEVNGVVADPFGFTRAGFTAKGRINRRDFGLGFNVPLDAGGVLVSEKIGIELEIAATLRT